MTERYLRGKLAPNDYSVDYDALEHLLLGIIDAVGETSMDRKKRLRTAYEALTGRRIDRVDEPDGVKAKAVAEYFRLEEEHFSNQDLPEFGGPTNEDIADNSELGKTSENELAKRAAEKFNETDEYPNLQEYIYKRVRGAYNNQRIQRNPLGYNAALADQHYSFDHEALADLQRDLSSIADILSKYNISMDLHRSFWRLRS